MRILTSAFTTRDEFLRSYTQDAPEGALFCRTRSELVVEQDLLVEVAFPGLINPTLLRGAVASIERGVGAWIRLHAGDAHGRDFLLSLARGAVEAQQVGPRSGRACRSRSVRRHGAATRSSWTGASHGSGATCEPTASV